MSEALEQAYNPRATVPDFQTYLDAAAAISRAARASLPAVLDLRYGPGPRQLLDLYPAEDPTAPLVVFVHGGFWRALSKEASANLAAALRPHGVATLLVGYDLCPQVTLEAIVGQIHDAFRWCGHGLAEQGLRPRKLVAAGSSAGAHLVAMTLFGEARDALPRIDAALLVSGIYELLPVLDISVNDTIGLDPETAQRLSPQRRVRRIDTHLVIAVGSEESAEWQAQSEDLHAACVSVGNEASWLLVDGAHHFSISPARAGSRSHEALLELCLGAPAAGPHVAGEGRS